MSHDYTAHVSSRATPQSEPIPGREADMVENTAGGYTFALDNWDRLRRFLVLGADGGTYYASERTLVKENAETVFDLLEEDGQRVVREIVDVLSNGRAPNPAPGLFALAIASAHGDEATRHEANQALTRVCHTPTHLFRFLDYRQEFGGWGSSLRKGVSDWYNSKGEDGLAYHLAKYQSRHGWTHRDALLLAHVKPETEEHDALYHWAAQGTWKNDYRHPQIEAMEEVHRVDDVDEAVDLILSHRLTREMIPTELLNEPKVWDALLEDMPLWAMLRNLANMTRVGLLKPMSDAAGDICSTLTDPEAVQRTRVHPIQVLTAMVAYSGGSGYRARNTSWDPVQSVVDALDEAFYHAFGNVEPTNKRLVLGMDVSGSMTCGNIAGIANLTPNVAAAAMALVTANVENQYTINGFSDTFRDLGISPNQRLDDVVKKTASMSFGATDCAVPMVWAMENDVDADAFIVYTDNETWAGRTMHPSQAIDNYRQSTGIPARLVVVGMTSTGFTIADPEDPGMMDVVGFDASAPNLINSFIRGEL